MFLGMAAPHGGWQCVVQRFHVGACAEHPIDIGSFQVSCESGI